MRLKKAFVERTGETYLEDGLVVPGKFSPVVSMVIGKKLRLSSHYTG